MVFIFNFSRLNCSSSKSKSFLFATWMESVQNSSDNNFILLQNMCFENEITSIIMLSIECCSCILEGRNWICKRLSEVELVVAFCSCPKSICNRYHFHKFIFLMLVCTSFRSFSFCCKLPQRHGQSWEKTLKNIVTKYLRGALRLTSSFPPQFHLLR